ncbi:carbamoyl-phosphate synthase, large subunit, partial [Vibrio parahaemolyticus VP2007-007]
LTAQKTVSVSRLQLSV